MSIEPWDANKICEKHPIDNTKATDTDDAGNIEMEVFGCGASAIAFIQVAATTCAVATDIVRRFRDAPEEFKQLARQLNLLQSELSFLNNLQSVALDNDLALLPNELVDLLKALKSAEALMRKVQNACQKFTPKHDTTTKTPAKLIWVFHDQSKMNALMLRLGRVLKSLHTILLLVNLRVTKLSRKAMETTSSLANTSNSAILRDIETIRKYVKESTRQGEKEQDIVLNCPVTRDPHDRLQFWKAIAFLEKSWLRFLGIEAVLSMYGNDYQTTYNFAARWSLHSLLGLKLVCCDVRLRRFPIAGLRLSFIAGGLTVRNVVPTDSAIMTACKTGDITSVKQLFRTRQASPNDVTPENSSPLRYAIENGSTELVQVILTSGADINAPFGQFMTAPLEWAFASRKIDVARLFILKGARVDHISAKGWTPAFNLFGYDWIHQTEGSCLEYLELLSSSSFSEFDIQDEDGWTAMHRAAAFGSNNDIVALIDRGALPTITTQLGWTPIRCALRFNNTETFLALVGGLGQNFDVDAKDLRGWTLLHEAASMGNLEMLSLVLQHGANPYTLTKATSWMVPENLKNQAVTPAGIAKRGGKNHYRTYIDSVKSVGLDITTQSDLIHEDSDDDVFWPAK